MTPSGFHKRSTPSAAPTFPAGASRAASAPNRDSAVARQTPFSANSTTRKPSQASPCAPRSSHVAATSSASTASRNGLRRPARSDQTPTGNWANPASAATVETMPMARSLIPCCRR